MKNLTPQESSFSGLLGRYKVEILDVLFLRLSAKGLTPAEIIRLIKNSFYIIREGGGPSAALMNQKLEQMGWEEQILDEATFDLIMFWFENRNGYAVIGVPLHYN